MKYLSISLTLILLASCSNNPLEYYIPDEPSNSYYLLLAGGSLNIGSEFKDEDRVFEIIEEDSKTNTLKYKQQFGMFDFETENGVITSVTTASPDIVLCSKYCVGMTKKQIMEMNSNLVIYQFKDRYVFVDNAEGCSIEAIFNEEGKSTILRITALKIK